MITPKNASMLEEKLNDDVQVMYNDFIEEGYIREALALKEKCGVDPSEEIMQKAYDHCFKKGLMDSVKRLKELSEIEPIINEEAVQEGYNNYLEIGDYSVLEEMKKFTKIDPIIDEEVVQKGYIDYFEKFIYVTDKELRERFKKTSITYSKELRDFTGVEPSKELLKKYGVDWE